ncbi:MAG: RNA 2',3'-cyclic phosphodiesterase [Pirellulaceae bacterium]|nr:RNA 2',3'-cyclic phosphodiesterase [Pirellulaceae bacterium]
MNRIRTFIAIPLAGNVTGGATKLIRKLRESDDGIKWVPTDNLHLTLKFLGDVENTEVPEICNALGTICDQYEPFFLNFAGTGGFPDDDKPRILYVGVEDPSGSLVKLVAEIETAMADLGFKPEPRDYRPHLTLGRTRSRSRTADSEVIARMKEHKDIVLGDMEVDAVELIASFMDKGGPTYQVMDTIEL